MLMKLKEIHDEHETQEKKALDDANDRYKKAKNEEEKSAKNEKEKPAKNEEDEPASNAIN